MIWGFVVFNFLCVIRSAYQKYSMSYNNTEHVQNLQENRKYRKHTKAENVQNIQQKRKCIQHTTKHEM